MDERGYEACHVLPLERSQRTAVTEFVGKLVPCLHRSAPSGAFNLEQKVKYKSD